MSNLRVGTCGWSYPTGRGTWSGIFYPARTRRGKARVDELAYYAEHFDTVEINTTFYGQPRPEVTRSWTERTPPGFEFSLKLYRQFTHPLMYERVAGRLDVRTGTSAVPRLDDEALDVFRRGIDPIASAGKLGALLAQFPPSFKDAPEARDYVDALLRRLGDYPVAIELRHRSWSDNIAGTLRLLNGHGAAWAQIDEPKFRFSIRQNQLPNVTSFYYMRLHGRNARAWWKHERTEDRYDYLYSAEELKFFSETADAARRLVKKLYLYFNNHFAAKGVVNAVMIKHQLGEPITGSYSEAFVECYPEVASLVSTEHRPLPVLGT